MKLGLEKNWSALSSWFKSAVFTRDQSQPPSQVAATAQYAFRPEQQSDALQWSKISAVVSGAIGSAALAGQLQRTASQQLDAAGYALDILKSELSAAMNLAAPAQAALTVVKLQRPLRTNKQQQALAA